MTNSDVTTADRDHRSSYEIGLDPWQVGDEHGCLVGGLQVIERPEQDERRRFTPTERDHRREVTVRGDDGATVGHRDFIELCIGSAAEPQVQYVDGVVAGVAKRRGDLAGQALVDEKLHAATKGRSIGNEAAANAKDAVTSSRVSDG